MHIDDRAHGVGVVGEADVVEEAAAQESVGQLLSLFDVITTIGRRRALTVLPVSRARTRRHRR
jgi:hypothetical protein